MNAPARRTLLLTGATGFVGRYVYEPLVEAGWTVRCATRNVAAAQERWPDREWVRLDVADADSVERAVERCDAALYLIHGMASHAEDFRQAEIHQAETFSASAARAGLKRIVYLGGVAAQADPSEWANPLQRDKWQRTGLMLWDHAAGCHPRTRRIRSPVC